MNRQNLGDPPGSSYRNRREDGNRPLGEGPRSERGERGYHGGPYRKRGYDEGPGEPNMQVILQGLEPHMNEIDIQRAIEGQGGEIESVILIRNRETRESRCFAFAKFISVEHSRRISYSKENKWEEEGWICFSCGINNYPRREVCFKCGVVKQDVTVAGNLTHSAPLVQNDGSQDIATTPSQFLLLRKLDVLTTEELIVKGMAKLQVPIVRVLLIRDRATRQSWGFAFVEYADVNESKKALANAMSLTSNKGFTISSKTIELSFIHGGVFVPVYDQKNEFGFKSSKNGQLLAYWDEKGFTSEYCPESQRPKDESNLPAGEINVSVSQNAASSDNNVSMKEPSILTKDTSTSLKRDANTPCEQKKQKKRYDNSSIKMAPHLQKWAVKQQELRTGLVENEKIDEIFSDLNLMACLLCQRKFKSEKEIRQHEKLSELHKKNLADDDLKEQARQRLKKVSIKKDTDVESLNDSNYRDRAQERRIAFNQPSKPDVPSHNSKKNVINSSPKIPEEPANITKGKGAAILGKMGWTEGMGLGLEGKGISKPLNPEVYQEGVGLGSLGAKLGDNPRPSDYAAYVRSVKDRAKRRYEMEGL